MPNVDMYIVNAWLCQVSLAVFTVPFILFVDIDIAGMAFKGKSL